MNLKFSKIIDISLPIEVTMATYPGETILIRPTQSIPKNKYNVQTMHIFTHTGTHFDAPWHVQENGNTLDRHELSRYIAPCVKIDLTVFKGELRRCGSALYLQKIEKKHLQQFEQQLRQAKAVVLHTGYGEVLKLGRQFIDLEFPYLAEEAARYLAQFSLELIGIDSLTIDRHECIDSHNILLAKNVLVLETLINLGQLPGHFTLLSLPISIKEADGAPCRAFALIE